MPDGRAVVKTAASRAFFTRGTGLRTSHIFTTADGAAQGLTGTTEFAPGAEVPWHTHNCEETVTILEGEALFEADGEQTELVAGDATWTPVGVVHRFANRGRGPLRILWTYGSVDATRTLVVTGATTSIAAESQANPAATVNI
jgi:quercetin dioxygenase-like cupin family protein